MWILIRCKIIVLVWLLNLVWGQLLAQESLRNQSLPKHLTGEELLEIERHPIVARRQTTAPPGGPIHCAAEYEPMAGILIAIPRFLDSDWAEILHRIAAQVTTVGNADIHAIINSYDDPSSIVAEMVAAGADGDRIHTAGISFFVKFESQCSLL